MDPKSLIQRSPLRAFDNALAGGLGRGNLGIVMSRHGTGKTPFLVGIAIDHLLRGERVLHISTDQKVDHVREFYDSIFDELAKESELDRAHFVKLELESRRRIHSYLANSFNLEKLWMAVRFMREHASYSPDLIVVDGLDLARLETKELSSMIELAGEVEAEMWMTAVRHRHEEVTDPEGIPAPVAAHKDLARVIVDLVSDGDVRIRLLKPAPASGDKILPVVLDRTTMLIHGT